MYDPQKIALTQTKDTLTATIKVARNAQAGTTTITIRANSDNTKSSSCRVTIKAVAGESSGNQDGNEQTECMHQWNDGVTTKEPTKTEDGVKKFTCTKCFKTKTEAIPALKHNHTIETEWTSDETHHWHKASCGIESHNENKEEHQLVTRVTEESTCAKSGTKETYCMVCKKVTETEVLAKMEHSWILYRSREPTETEDGERFVHCEKCGEEKTVVIPALGHNHTIITKWTSDETHHWHEADCGIESHGSEKEEHIWKFSPANADKHIKTCTICNYESIEFHELTERTIKEATCIENGEKETYCALCKKVTKTEAIPALESSHTISTTWTSDETHHWHEADCGIESHGSEKEEHIWALKSETDPHLEKCTVCNLDKRTEHETVTMLMDNGARRECCSICNTVISETAWTLETLSELTDALIQYKSENAMIKVAGEISDLELSTIGTALYKARYNKGDKKGVVLDLSDTTGITEITKDAIDSLFYSRIDPSDMQFYPNKITSLIIPNSVTSIGDSAFSGYTSLTEVTIPGKSSAKRKSRLHKPHRSDYPRQRNIHRTKYIRKLHRPLQRNHPRQCDIYRRLCVF